MMGQMKNIVIDKEALDAWRANHPPMVGEVFDDGQFRGGLSRDFAQPPVSIKIGDYVLWGNDDDTFYILFEPTGELGAFKKEDFVAHVAAFFGLHF